MRWDWDEHSEPIHISGQICARTDMENSQEEMKNTASFQTVLWDPETGFMRTRPAISENRTVALATKWGYNKLLLFVMDASTIPTHPFVRNSRNEEHLRGTEQHDSGTPCISIARHANLCIHSWPHPKQRTGSNLQQNLPCMNQEEVPVPYSWIHRAVYWNFMNFHRYLYSGAQVAIFVIPKYCNFCDTSVLLLHCKWS